MSELLTPATLLAHWQGHRRLTRRVIEAFPDDQLFSFSIGGMRPFGRLGWEMAGTVANTLHALEHDDWTGKGVDAGESANTKAALLDVWDAGTARLNAGFPSYSAQYLATEQDMAWGRGSPMRFLLYQIDNEVHHRGQGYVYLRALGIEPPPFYVR